MVIKKNHFLAAIALLVAMTGFTSCLKNNVQPQRPISSMVVMNVAAVTFDLDTYLNGTKAAALSGLKFNGAAGVVIDPGTYTVLLKPVGKDSTVASLSATYDTSVYYTHLIYGAPTKIFRIDETPNFTQDGLSGSKVNIRFFHMGENIGAVDFYLNDTKVFSNRTYEDFTSGGSAYLKLSQIDQPASSVKLTVKLAGTETVVATSTENAQLFAGAIYTSYLGGVNGNTGTLKPIVHLREHR